MIVLMMGPPGVGKGTQAALLSKHFGWPHISTGDMLRRASKQGLGEAADQLRELLAAGHMAPDALVARLLKERLVEEDCRNGYFLDGYPRNPVQAEELLTFLRETGERVDLVIELHAEPEVIRERISGRLTDPETGAIYHRRFSPPPDGAIAARVFQRPEDHEDIVTLRLQQFERETRSTIRDLHLLSKQGGFDSPAFKKCYADTSIKTVQANLLRLVEEARSASSLIREVRKVVRRCKMP